MTGESYFRRVHFYPTTSAKGGVQVVDIAPGDGKVFHNPVRSYPEIPNQKTYLILDADQAIIIPSKDGLHLFPIDETHLQYKSHYNVCPRG